MQINTIKINGFGNLKEKDIQLQSGINIIKGKNESGKSTLLKFIPAMFYGLAKIKNGKEISDLEKYRPWNIDEFSGKIYYTLDNKEKIEVYRDFNKKTCKIYNEKGEEITENYEIDKSKQNQFFIEQTGISEDILMRTAISEQTETKLDKESQNAVIQKISNVLSTGNDNISYKKALTKLRDKQTEEVGTERTIGRPINIVKSELKKYREKEAEIKLNLEHQKNYEEEKLEASRQIKEIKNNLEILNELKTLKEKEYLEREKININKNLLYEHNEKIQELYEKENEINKNTVIKKDNKYLVIFLTILILSAIIGVVLKNIIIFGVGAIISLIFLYMQINLNVKNKKIANNKNEKILNIKKEIEIIEKTVEEKEAEIVKQEETLKKAYQEECEKIKAKNINNVTNASFIKNDLISNSFDYNIGKLKNEITNQENRINSLKLKISTIEITYKGVLEKLEELPKIEEKIEELEEQEEELYLLNNSIELAKQVLEQAYEKMKENITPEFVKNLSEMVKKVSNSKYSNMKFNDTEGLTVELESGEYVKADKLSIGTIDQMYLSLRLASLKEVVKEKMPIILDEPFAYYDNERLEKIFEFLNNNYSNEQIIIFTCSDREEKILDNKKIQYELVELY